MSKNGNVQPQKKVLLVLLKEVVFVVTSTSGLLRPGWFRNVEVSSVWRWGGEMEEACAGVTNRRLLIHLP